MSDDGHCFDLFREEPSQFDPENFLQEFGPWRWCYLAGFFEIVNTAILATPHPTLASVRRQIRFHSAHASGLLPPQWCPSFPGCEWEDCDRMQGTYAYRKQLLRFDKATILAWSVARTFAGGLGEHTLPWIDVCKHLILRPVVYRLTGLDEWQFLIQYPRRITDGERRMLCRLKRELKATPKSLTAKPAEAPRDPQTDRFNWNDGAAQFIKRAIEGDAMTWRNAILLRNAFHEVGIGAEIEVLQRRTAGRLRQCNAFESPFVGLTRDQMNALRTSFRLQHQA